MFPLHKLFFTANLFLKYAVLLCGLLLAGVPACPAAQPAGTTDAALTVQALFAQDNKQPLAVLELGIPDGYYAYAPGNPEGKPTAVRLASPAGSHQAWFEAGDKKNSLAPKEHRVYRNSAYIFLALTQGTSGAVLQGEVEALLCSDAHCLPQRIPFRAEIPRTLPSAAAQPWHEAWTRTRQHTPRTLHAAAVSAAAPAAVTPAMPIRAIGAPAQAQPAREIPALETAPELPNLTPRYADASLEVRDMGKALLLGFFAGLLLNIMPCVLPVLTLKVSGLLLAAHGDPAERYRQFREHNLFFAAGIMTWFTVLALALGMAGLMWGQLFQNQVVILGMLLVVFLLALSMLGVFTLPMVDLKSGTSGNPRVQAFSTGLLATLLATPCSGPLLGGVLGWAFTQPVSSLVVVFCAVGLGMSFPYILFAFRPHLVRLLPHPGAWMGILEKMMGFFLLGTAVYLLSILPAEKHLQVLTALLLVALCAWLWGHFCGYSAPPRRRLLGRLAGLCLLAGGLWWAMQPPQPEIQWQAFTKSEFSSMLGEKPLLVEFTADWCPNCKFLEASVLTDRRLHAVQQRYGVTLMRVDLTQEDADAKALLEQLGARSIPVTALFPAGKDSARPLVLRDVYSADTLEQAMEQVFTAAPHPQ